MRVESFYQTSTEQNAITLVLLSEAMCLTGLLHLSDAERQRLNAQQFIGRLGQVVLMNDEYGVIVKVFIGSGAKQTDAQAIAAALNGLPVGCYVSLEPLSDAACVAWSLGQYQFDRYKPSLFPPKRLVLSEQQLPMILADASAVFLVRDLINTPTNDMGPKELSVVVAELASSYDAEFHECVGDSLLQENFPAIHAVGRAGPSEPRLLSLLWGDKTHPRVTLVGKGVCFDSGGLDIKPSSGMRFMKKDMGGAAQVIGLAQWLMTHRVPIRLHVLIPAVENSLDANAYRPGDVLTMRNGMTVEVHNTDAEGRLVLADALVKACEEKPELLIDFATLTGAARVAVGTEIAAMFVNDDGLAKEISDAADVVSDPVWRLPLFQGYEDLFASKIADIANASDSSYAGATTAALFLQRFVSVGLPWLHFDIMAWNVSSKPGKPEGGEAMGMRAVGQYLRARYG